MLSLKAVTSDQIIWNQDIDSFYEKPTAYENERNFIASLPSEVTHASRGIATRFVISMDLASFDYRLSSKL